jgi:hypothetical protein
MQPLHLLAVLPRRVELRRATVGKSPLVPPARASYPGTIPGLRLHSCPWKESNLLSIVRSDATGAAGKDMVTHCGIDPHSPG